MAEIVCPHCGETFDAHGEIVQTGMSSSSGEPRRWVLVTGAGEAHRCDFRDDARSAPASA